MTTSKIEENKKMTETKELVKKETLSIDTIKSLISKDANDDEIKIFLQMCKDMSLNPFKREIYLIKYKNSPAQYVVGYETYLKRAEDSGKLDGWECVADKDSATIIIHRTDRKIPFKWTVLMSEFNKGQSIWRQMPSFMLRKVAIAQGMRLCFPKEVGELPYTAEEIVTADVIPPIPQIQQPKEQEQPQEETRKNIADITGIPEDILREYLKTISYDYDNLNKAQYDKIINGLEKFIKAVNQFVDKKETK